MQVHKYISLAKPLCHQLAQLSFFFLPQHFFQLVVASLETTSQHDAEHISDTTILVGIAGHVFTWTDRITNL